MSEPASFRIEKDLLGTLPVPADAYYGIQTLRALNNFRLSGVPLSHYPKLVIGNIEAAAKVDDATVTDMLHNMPGLEQEEEQDPTQGMEGAEQPAEGDAAEPAEEEVDPAKALEDELKSEKTGQ
jgi:hypothetical protein